MDMGVHYACNSGHGRLGTERGCSLLPLPKCGRIVLVVERSLSRPFTRCSTQPSRACQALAASVDTICISPARASPTAPLPRCRGERV